QRLQCGLCEVACIDIGGPAQLERLQVVMGEHLRVIVGPSEPAYPFGRSAMSLHAFRAWDLPVRDVAHEQMAKRVFELPGDRAGTLAPQELLPLERMQPLL